MKVKDIMTAAPCTCTAATNLAEAAHLMLQADCGFLPVVDDDGRLTGVVTDRDMFIAVATRNQLAWQIRVADVARHTAFTCGPDDDLEQALAIMKEHRVRRLPVEGFGGIVAGVISMNDIVRNVGRGRVANAAVVDTFQAICSPPRRTAHIAAA